MQVLNNLTRQMFFVPLFVVPKAGVAHMRSGANCSLKNLQCFVVCTKAAGSQLGVVGPIGLMRALSYGS
jgi:Na+/H+ antiporter NhaA